MIRSRSRPALVGTIAALAVALALVACGDGSTNGGGADATSGLGVGAMPTLSPLGGAGASPCTLPPRVQTPSWIPANLPWPDGSYVTKDFGGSGNSAAVVVPTSQQAFAAFFRDRWPKAGYTLGEGDAEPGRELDQEFASGSAEGHIKAQVVTCDPGYQLVFLTYRPG
jgi:hypothetical protein